MHTLWLRSLLYRTSIAASRKPGTSSNRWFSNRRSQPNLIELFAASRQERSRLHVFAPLLDQNTPPAPDQYTPPAAALSGEVCSLRCRLYDIPNSCAEDLADILMAFGAQSVSIEEYRPEGQPEQEIFVADNSAADRLWDRCTVIAYLPPEADASRILQMVKCDCGLDHNRHSVEEVRQQDWEESIRDSYQPTQVDLGLWIVPIWCSPPEPSATNIVLEPGLAFGTGDHPTTRMCLRWLKQLGLRGGAVMDYGTGSGVLAVAALLLGAERAVGTDVEPLSITAAQANAAHNCVAPRLTVYQCQPDVTAAEPLEQAGVAEDDRSFDVVVANILQGPLLSLAPRLAAYAKPGAALGLSGILAEQVPAVEEAYSPFFQGFTVQQEEQWALVTATRKER